MIQFLERPAYISFSKNEIRYVFTTDKHNEPGCAVEIKIVTRKLGQQTNNQLVSFVVYPDATGRIYLTIQDYLDGALEPFMPTLNGTLIQPAETQQLKYWIEYRELTTALTQTPDFISDDFYTKVVLLGGVEEMKFLRDNWFATYHRTKLPFLTYQPAAKPVAPDQRHYITFLSDGAPGTSTVRFIVHYTDNTSITKDITFNTTDNFLFHINTGIKENGLQLLSTATIWKYEVRVVQIIQPNPLMLPRTIIQANPYTFLVNYTNTYQHYDLIYFNSISGLDCIRVRGEVAKSTSITFDDTERILANRDYNTTKPASQFGTTNRAKRNTYKGDIGWQSNPDEQEALTELLLSPAIFQEVAGRWISIISLRKSQDFATALENKWNFPIEFSYGYSDRSFTPEALNLGEGTAPQLPPVISFVDDPFTAFAFPLSDGERIYWDAANTGAATHYKVELFADNTWTTPSEPGELLAADITTNKNYKYTYSLLKHNTTYWVIVTAFIMNGANLATSRPVKFTTQ